MPWYVAQRADYGITGEDLIAEYNAGNSGNSIQVLDKLGFGKGDLVVFASDKPPAMRQPKVAVPLYYRNLARNGAAGAYFQDAFGEYEIIDVNGSTEGFVADGTADYGFDFTTYFTRLPEERARTTLAANGLVIVEKILPTEAVAVAKNSTQFTMEEFERALNGPYELNWRKMRGLLPVIAQDAATNEILMQAYANQNALQRTLETGLATFWSRARQELWTKGLTSGNTMEVTEILYDCDGDALVYKVRPDGPACHTEERSCFYRKLFERGENP